MGIEQVGTTRRALGEIGRLADIANTPASAELARLAKETQSGLAGRTRVRESIASNIRDAHQAVTKNGAAFPSDAEVGAATAALTPAARRVQHPLLGVLADHPDLTMVAGMTSALLLPLAGFGLLSKLRTDRRERDAKDLASRADLDLATAKRLIEVSRGPYGNPTVDALAERVNSLRGNLHRAGVTVRAEQLAGLVALDLHLAWRWRGRDDAPKLPGAWAQDLAPALRASNIDDAALPHLAHAAYMRQARGGTAAAAQRTVLKAYHDVERVAVDYSDEDMSRVVRAAVASIWTTLPKAISGVMWRWDRDGADEPPDAPRSLLNARSLGR